MDQPHSTVAEAMSSQALTAIGDSVMLGVASQLQGKVEGTQVDAEVSRRYGAWREREVEGRSRFCMTRSTFIIDRKGVIRYAQYGVNPRGHAGEILECVRALHTKGIRNAHQQELGRHP